MSLALLTLVGLQTTWIVDAANGPGTTHTNLPPAIAAAQSGDTVVVRVGSYDPFQVAGKALVVRGVGSSQTSVVGANGAVMTTIDAVPTGAVFAVSGLALTPPPLVLSANVAPAALTISGGSTVVMNDCSLAGTDVPLGITTGFLSSVAGDAVVVSGGSLLVAARIDLVGGGVVAALVGAGGAAARVRNADLIATDCRFRGGDSAVFKAFGSGGHGIHVENGTVLVHSCDVTGGDSFGGSSAAGDGISLAGPTAFARVAGTTMQAVSGGDSLSSGVARGTAIAVRDPASSVVVHNAVQLVAPTTQGNVILGQPELPRVTLAGAASGSGDLRSGSPVTLQITSSLAQAPAVLGVGERPTSPTRIPGLLVGELALAATAFRTPLLLDASGQLQVTFAAPSSPVFVGRPLFAQAVVLDIASNTFRGSNLEVRSFRR